MVKKHIVELLVEANKQISNVINKMESNNSQNNNVIINEVNDIIRQLDEVVEHLEK